MNESLGSKIGEGGCAEVYEWEGGSKAVKLAKPNTNVYAIQRELRNTRIAWESGLPVPRPYEYIEIDGRPGAIFERIEGESMMQSLITLFMNSGSRQTDSGKPPLFHEVIVQTVQLMHRIHMLPAADMPLQRDDIEYGIRNQDHLNEEEKDAVIAILERLPRKRQMCHGDLNPGNFIIRSGEPVIIDWSNASCGNPEADVAEYIVMMRYGILPPELASIVGDAVEQAREPMIERFLEEYTRLSGVTYAEVEPWIAPIAARKLSGDAISEEEKQRLAAVIRRQIALGR